jgi:hypothetical protein
MQAAIRRRATREQLARCRQQTCNPSEGFYLCVRSKRLSGSSFRQNGTEPPLFSALRTLCSSSTTGRAGGLASVEKTRPQQDRRAETTGPTALNETAKSQQRQKKDGRLPPGGLCPHCYWDNHRKMTKLNVDTEMSQRAPDMSVRREQLCSNTLGPLVP